MSDKVKCVFTFPNTEADDANGESFSMLDLPEKRPVIVILGWGGSLDKHLAKYSLIYEQKRYITVRYTAPSIALFFNHGALATLTKGVLDALVEKNLNDHPLLFHIFSNGGCYVYCHIIKILRTCESFYKFNIKGCIIDSAPGKRRIFKAAKAFMVICPVNIVFKYLIGFGIIVYLFVSYIFVLLRGKSKSSDLFLLFESMLNDENRWPQLFLYSKSDEIIGYKDIQDIIEHRKSLGVSVSSTCFDQSAHVGHFLKQKEIYTNLCQQFIERCLNS